jgi:hypothetical protein
VLLARNIVATEQMGKGRELLGPGEFFRHTAQVDHIVGARDGGQWRVVRPQQGQPTKDVGIRSAEISQEMPDGSAIGGDGCVP